MCHEHNHCLFLPKLRCSCHDQKIRNITRATPRDDQKITNHTGIGLGYRPGGKLTLKWWGTNLDRYFNPLQKENDSIIGKVPCPNLMQMRSSMMHIASESQQKAPTFFTGFLKFAELKQEVPYKLVSPSISSIQPINNKFN